MLQGLQSGRSSDHEITIFDSVGFALEDLSALRYLLALANASDIGQALEIVPRMHDPKDLYGYAMDRSPALVIAM
ncbi:ornithine cyclodeaminase [compost metagenome]